MVSKKRWVQVGRSAQRFFLATFLGVLFAWSASARDFSELADLQVNLSSPSTAVTNGTWVTFVVTARNNGPTPIYAVDDCEIQCVPADGQYGDDGAGGGDPSDAVVSGPGTIDKSDWIIRWFPGAIAPGQSVVMTVSIPLHIRDQDSLHTATANGGYSNADVCDTVPGNNDDTLLLGYVGSSDLSLSINNQGNTEWDLTSGHYELILTASNAGPSVAHGTVVTNILPPGCTYTVDWPDAAFYDIVGNVLTWRVADHNEPGSTSLWTEATALMYLQITPTNAGEKVVTSTLYHPDDPNTSNNTADNSMSVTGTTGGGSDQISVQLMGWDVVPTVERYGTIQYVLRLKNNGTGDVTNVTITNWLDSRCLFDAVSTPQGSATQSNGVVVFDIGTLVSGADLYMDVFATPLESGILTNESRVYMTATGNEYGDSLVLEETTVNEGPYVLTVTPAASVTPVLGFLTFDAVVQTNGQTVSGVPISLEVTRGPHMGTVSNAMTTSPGIGMPAKAVLDLEDEAGYPGLDYVTFTGQVGQIPFSLNVQADWQMMGPQTYTCTNLGFIVNDGVSSFEIVVPDGFEIADIKTGLHFEHTFPGDLEFRLYSPEDFGEAAIESYLIEETDAFAFDDLEVGRSNAFCVLDESAAVNITNSVSPFSGGYTSQSLEMTNYVGAESMGTWVLQIEDMNLVDFDYGELLGWTLTLDPADGDLDNDGMNDVWEGDNGLDPTDPTDGDDDDDGDGVSNRNEFRTRTRPQIKSDAFGASRTGMGDEGFFLYWTSQSNQFYSIFWGTTLMEDMELLEGGIAADPPENEYLVTNLSLRSAYFRIDQEY